MRRVGFKFANSIRRIKTSSESGQPKEIRLRTKRFGAIIVANQLKKIIKIPSLAGSRHFVVRFSYDETSSEGLQGKFAIGPE